MPSNNKRPSGSYIILYKNRHFTIITNFTSNNIVCKGSGTLGFDQIDDHSENARRDALMGNKQCWLGINLF
jgi:hypothetical protein